MGMYICIVDVFNVDVDIEVSMVMLQDFEYGLIVECLVEIDVLLWWGYVVYGDVFDDVVEWVCDVVWFGMGMVFLYLVYFVKLFKCLMGGFCNLIWCEVGECECFWVMSCNYLIMCGLFDYFELDMEEMYGEFFGVLELFEIVFISWFQGGEVFCFGLIYKCGVGNIFYFCFGYEIYLIYYDVNIQLVLKNGVKWVYNLMVWLVDLNVVLNVLVDKVFEVIEECGLKFYVVGEEGFC